MKHDERFKSLIEAIRSDNLENGIHAKGSDGNLLNSFAIHTK